MVKKIDQGTEAELRLGRRVSREVAVLLNEIENEPVPDRLLELAQQLQKALSEKLEK
ncbi:hypothetical protein REJC140_00767 [Pseudorhizobium endolithicum]|uniref:Anti-sigma factor NepR domain-containing protein n=1 Tax=Pseudorhizobium endolithicum TaxID=1191678 RepID=A0ABM8PNK9_9HYPH|nr:hypothetical protein [Pseudorhizobium endolithicum]CAD6407070.1 hypothetical protein REQ54_00224 [Rhizobium sp. Q54]CAD7039570.1 hypothetical protein REJC140_00767 [Pseudorhizobium endolithicum]